MISAAHAYMFNYSMITRTGKQAANWANLIWRGSRNRLGSRLDGLTLADCYTLWLALLRVRAITFVLRGAVLAPFRYTRHGGGWRGRAAARYLQLHDVFGSQRVLCRGVSAGEFA